MSRAHASAVSRRGAPAHPRSSTPVSAQQRLPAAERAYFERAFGEDFSDVRVHTDASAATLASALHANAVTKGDDIAFASGRYRPGSTQGRTLLAHELAHVAQQRRGGGVASQVEPRARSAAQSAAHGGRVEPSALGGAQEGMHCDPDDKNKVDTPSPASLPPLKLTTPGPLDWFALQQSYRSRGLRLELRDAQTIEKESQRISDQLGLFGITPGFKLNYGLGTLTYADLINMSLSKQLENQLGAENPNSWDRLNRQWQLANPGFTTPILSKTWTF